jgi:hypothetical protein
MSSSASPASPLALTTPSASPASLTAPSASSVTLTTPVQSEKKSDTTSDVTVYSGNGDALADNFAAVSAICNGIEGGVGRIVSALNIIASSTQSPIAEKKLLVEACAFMQNVLSSKTVCSMALLREQLEETYASLVTFYESYNLLQSKNSSLEDAIAANATNFTVLQLKLEQHEQQYTAQVEENKALTSRILELEEKLAQQNRMMTNQVTAILQHPSPLPTSASSSSSSSSDTFWTALGNNFRSLRTNTSNSVSLQPLQFPTSGRDSLTGSPLRSVLNSTSISTAPSDSMLQASPSHQTLMTTSSTPSALTNLQASSVQLTTATASVQVVSSPSTVQTPPNRVSPSTLTAAPPSSQQMQ